MLPADNANKLAAMTAKWSKYSCGGGEGGGVRWLRDRGFDDTNRNPNANQKFVERDIFFCKKEINLSNKRFKMLYSESSF